MTVTRGATPDRFEIYTAAVPKRLPKFKLPLAPDDRDTVLDLQTAFARAYDLGGFAKQLDYAAPLPADVKLVRRHPGLGRRPPPPAERRVRGGPGAGRTGPGGV